MIRSSGERRRETPLWLWISGMVLLVAVLWSLTGWYVVRDRRQQLDFAADSARVQVQLLAEHTAALFRQVELGLRTLCGINPENTSLAGDRAAICTTLRRTVLDLPGVDNAVVLAPDGSIRCALRPPGNDVFPFTELLLRHRDEMLGFWITPSSVVREYITLSIRLDDEYGELTGIIAATIPSDYFTSRFHEYGTVNAELIAIYDEDRSVLVQWSSGDDPRGQIGTEPLLADVPGVELVSGGLRSAQTERSVFAMFQLPGFAYRIVIATGLPVLLEEWRSQAVILGGVTFVLSLTIVAAGTWIHSAGERKRRVDEELIASRAREQEGKIERLEGLRTLAGGLAHSINNRMMVVFGNAQLLESTSAADSHVLRSIQEAARQTAALSERMQSSAGNASLTSSVFDVADLLASREPVLLSLVGGQAELLFDLGSSPHFVNGDEQLIETAVLNLVENAIEATQAAGRRIAITVKDVQISGPTNGHWSGELVPGAYVAIRVEDNGEGMDDAHLKRVFDPFFSVRFLGRGMGLSAVAGIARQHGGAVAMESEPGSGTAATLFVPVAKEIVTHGKR